MASKRLPLSFVLKYFRKDKLFFFFLITQIPLLVFLLRVSSSNRTGQSSPQTSSLQSELTEVEKDLTLRCLLWESLQEWQGLVDQWEAASFESLKIEDVQQNVARFIQTIFLLEKGICVIIDFVKRTALSYYIAVFRERFDRHIFNAMTVKESWRLSFWQDKYKTAVEIPLTNRVRGPYCKLRTEFFPVDLWPKREARGP